MLNKEQHIQFWVKQAEDDWGAVEALLASGKYVQCLFWAHLVAEKYAKAVWIRHNDENIPPKTHNIAFLVSRTKLEVPEELMEKMLLANKFNMEGRYPEYIQNMEITDKIFAEENVRQIKTLIVWLKKEFAIKTAQAFIKDCNATGLFFDKVFLFGSYAKENAHDWSDVDLLLVSKKFTTNIFDNLKLYLKVNAKYPIVETHPYPADYFAKGDAFIEDVLKTSIEIV